MLIPRKIKYRKQQRGKRRGVSNRGYSIDFGKYGLKAVSTNWLTSRQIEAARRAITRFVKRGGKIWIRVFPAQPVTSTPAETGMGGGKGSLDHFVARVLRGRMLFEIDGVTEEIAKEAFKLAAAKLPVETQFVKKEEE
ncbi:MAG: 50S ribosomal protein L16 [Candidatus Nealsonbacteria bacterium CG23_combo_of_CG06-09_8_20_14_all_40_13]|uniref:Large ribosomal subunit protein uL16 n=1 Tax=Candidatus Nealsonbacteria bacterium CG23_combo_of_CG06-09_8_20_14_all_40_13 TaxID=1974724 RepID=A0A2G9YQS9_9BACT|nr:MAG: 50S ribosomal protein L16 [Candidatus Nealsonbacteria bacterium CG23_combo_of_CG06-09_8_20_14_all_40_13]PIR71196.1 MAG: 50S ribosomal protein L16 [Candidatus Nealsonbacteria bacterium CG10_big_fil_rev_8_21_14_0_10_40_24]PIU43440.1 MAG: 50S ribosomal protein L16 [Candidatus Nealsonbacteria bacterium CG07_land_8_20_14_0_80_40_10]